MIGEDKMRNEMLFAGKANPFGGLSNEQELALECRNSEFRIHWTTNDWCEYVTKVFFGGADTSNWKWKSNEADTKTLQKTYFNSLLGGWGLKHEDKTAVAGWMLSEMLSELPKYLSPKKESK
jgi:hypothetical protein